MASNLSFNNCAANEIIFINSKIVSILSLIISAAASIYIYKKGCAISDDCYQNLVDYLFFQILFSVLFILSVSFVTIRKIESKKLKIENFSKAASILSQIFTFNPRLCAFLFNAVLLWCAPFLLLIPNLNFQNFYISVLLIYPTFNCFMTFFCFWTLVFYLGRSQKRGLK